MTKHGFSHAGATLVCAVASGLLVRQVDKHVPSLNPALGDLSEWIRRTFDLSVPPEAITQWLLMGMLAFVWGVAFKLTMARN